DEEGKCSDPSHKHGQYEDNAPALRHLGRNTQTEAGNGKSRHAFKKQGTEILFAVSNEEKKEDGSQKNDGKHNDTECTDAGVLCDSSFKQFQVLHAPGYAVNIEKGNGEGGVFDTSSVRSWR